MRAARARVRGATRRTRRSSVPGPPSDGSPAPGRQRRALTAVLADGMGGHAGGALASATACKIFLRAYETSSGEVPARLDEALQLANAAIAELRGGEPGARRHGLHADRHRVRAGGRRMGQRRRQPAVPGAPGRDRAAQRGPLAGARDRQAGRRRQDELGGRQGRSAPAFPALGADRRRDRARSTARTGRWRWSPATWWSSPATASIRSSQPDILRVVERALRRAGPTPIADALLAAVDAAGDLYQDNTTVVVVRFNGS